MSSIIAVYRGLDILKKHLKDQPISSDTFSIFAGGIGSAKQISLTDVELAMLENAGWVVDPTANCWKISCSQ